MHGSGPLADLKRQLDAAVDTQCQRIHLANRLHALAKALAVGNLNGEAGPVSEQEVGGEEGEEGADNIQRNADAP